MAPGAHRIVAVWQGRRSRPVEVQVELPEGR
jgi:hypothetical protein